VNRPRVAAWPTIYRSWRGDFNLEIVRVQSDSQRCKLEITIDYKEKDL
jgi:hypothetical protein